MKTPITPSRILVGLAIGGALAFGGWKLIASISAERAAAREAAAQTARQAAIDRTAFYRVRSSYIVKDTGEHVDFDYVAACQVFETHYRDGDRSVDTPFGVTPNVFIAPTRDGHAILVVTPRACQHQAETGDIPPDLIPLTMFFEDMTNLRFGWGYTSQDAYDNARARISFEGASIVTSSYAAWLAWREKATAEHKPFLKVSIPWGYSYSEQSKNLDVARDCHFYVRAPVVAEIRAVVTAEWEKRGRPEFWVFGNGSFKPEFLSAFPKHREIFNYPQPRTKGGGVGNIFAYQAQRSATRQFHRGNPYPSNEVYPYLPISFSSTPPPDLAARVFPTKIPLSDDWKGLAACGLNDLAIDDVLFSNGGFNPSILKQRAWEPVGDRTAPVLVNDTVVDEIRFNRPPQLIFQRDEFALRDHSGPVEGIQP